MKTPQDPLDAEIHEMLDFYWKAAKRQDESRPSPVSAASKPRGRKLAVSKKLSALRAMRHAVRENARLASRSTRRAD
jgi:hypothetical protein